MISSFKYKKHVLQRKYMYLLMRNYWFCSFRSIEHNECLNA